MLTLTDHELPQYEFKAPASHGRYSMNPAVLACSRQVVNILILSGATCRCAMAKGVSSSRFSNQVHPVHDAARVKMCAILLFQVFSAEPLQLCAT